MARSLIWMVPPMLVLLGGCGTATQRQTSLPPVEERQAPAQTRTVPPREGVEVGTIERSGGFTPAFDQPPSSDSGLRGGSSPAGSGEGQGGRSSSAAVVALMDTAGQQAAAGDFDRAAATLERAVRIEPTNAALWHDLGEVRYRQGEFSQAESMAVRSNSLAGSEYRLQARNWRLIERARAGRGDLAGSDAAAAQAVLIERRL